MYGAVDPGPENVRADAMNESSATQENKRWRPIVAQVAAAAIANIACLAPAMSLGFSAVALPKMVNGTSNPPITDEEASWIASLATISTPLGCLLAGPLLDRLGRKAALLLLNVPCLLGWVLVATAPNGPSFLTQLYAGRIFCGIATGMASIPATVYSAEVADSSLRGMLVTWTSVAIATGILIVYILGYFLQDWRLIATICAVFPVAAAGLITLLPESPVWLMSRSRYSRAEVSLRKLRGVKSASGLPTTVQTELDAFASGGSGSNRRTATSIKEIWTAFQQPQTWKPFLIMNTFFFFQQFSGIFVVIFYAVDIVQEANVTIDDYLAAVLIGATRTATTLCVSYLCNRFGRRAPAIVSGAGMTICMGVLATYLTLSGSTNIELQVTQSLSWVPVTALMMYILASTIGFLTLPWAMIGELFPPEVRGIASGFTTCMAYAFSFVILKIYPDMLRLLSRQGVFFFYGAMSLFGTVYVIMFLPETKNKSFAEIERSFMPREANKHDMTQQQEVKKENIASNGLLARSDGVHEQRPLQELS